MSIKASNNPFPHDPDDNWKEKLDRGGYPGTAKDLFDKISQIDAPDGILIAGEITRIGNVFSIGASTFTCRIKQQELVNQDDFSTTIVNASDNYKRIDILVFTKFSTIIKIQGDEDLVSAKEPDVPTGTIKLAFFSIFGNQVDEHNEPIIIPDISEKLDRGGFEGTAQDIVNAIPDPSEFWRKLDKDGYDGTAKTLKDEIDSGLLLKENKENKATDFAVVNDQLYPTIKASKTYIDNGLSLKENLSNKAVNFNVVNDDLYPTVKLLKTNLDSINSILINLSDNIQLKEDKDQKGIINGYAGLDANGKVPLDQINDALIGNVKYSGLYNGLVISSSPDGSLNGLPLPSPSTTNRGWYFIASTSFVNSGKDYANGDWIISNGSMWDRVDNTDAVSTVFGRVGHVTAQNGDYNTGLVTEIANKNYQTDNQKLFNDATSSIQIQLNSKQPNLGFTPEPAFSKNTAFNKNFGVIAGTVAEGNDSRILNGQTAFGWGNHASAGYVFSNGSNASGNWGINVTGNSATATKWLTPIALTIGNTYKAVDGTTNVSWSLAEIGAQPLLTNPITGNLTTNFIPKSTGGGGLVNSLMSDNGAGVGIGTISPVSLLDVFQNNNSSSVIVRNSLNSFYIGNSVEDNVSFIGGYKNDNSNFVNLQLQRFGGNVSIGTTTSTAKLTLSGINEGACIDILNTSQNLKTRIGTGNVGGHFFIENNAGVEILRVGQNGNVGIGGNPISGGSASKWLALNGSTTYSGGIVLAIQGVQKGFLYSDNNFTTVQAVEENGIKLVVNGSTEALAITTNGTAIFSNSVNAPTFNGKLNGSASKWNNENFGPLTNATPFYAMGYVVANSRWEPIQKNEFSSFLDLGSNAYTSTAYLPLTGGQLTNNLTISAGYNIGYSLLDGFSITRQAGKTLFAYGGVGKMELSDAGLNILGTITASGGFFNSDKRLKDVIKRDGNVAYFKWKDGRDDKIHIGYIAQEVQKTNPDQVIKDKDGILSVNYTEMLVLKVKSLENRVRELEGGRHGVC